MDQNKNCAGPAGWIGGFAQSNPKFAYPNPDLSSLPMTGNMANIPLLRRLQGVKWPEFSWETIPGKPDSRCFQMFSPEISRIGYDNTGRVYSIICPQQGFYMPNLVVLNVEVTVTGVRGWVDEPTHELAAEMTVEGRIWFSASKDQSPLVKLAWDKFKSSGWPFPSDKAHAIIVKTNLPGNPDQPIFPVRKGETTLFTSPAFARHEDEACAVANIGVQIGPIQQTDYLAVNLFNQGIIDIFNLATGNMLQNGNLLTWNVWFIAPDLVDEKEWTEHAEKWRKSIDSGQGSPTGPGTPARYFDGRPFSPFGSGELTGKAPMQEQVDLIESKFEDVFKQAINT